MQHPDVDIRFFLAQPATPELAAAWLPRLQVRWQCRCLPGWQDCSLKHSHQQLALLPSRQEEASRHRDLVVLRGADTYLNLPNKTLRILRYALAHPAGKPSLGACGVGHSALDTERKFCPCWFPLGISETFLLDLQATLMC